jgi:GNAT superfamily N-acetyltransferase
MLCPFEQHDLNQLSRVIHKSVTVSVASNEDEASFLITDIEYSLKKWFDSGANGYSSAYRIDNKLIGFIIVKEFWNLSHLFVHPKYQRKGIGSSLVEAAIENCRTLSPRNKIQLNSSKNAAPFYEHAGFKQSGESVDRPGGCIPFEYAF